MAVFPEHVHVDGEDRLLKRAESADWYRHVMEEFLGVLIVVALSLVAAVVVLTLI